MIARVLTGRLRSDVDAATKEVAWKDASKACHAQKGCREAYFLEPPAAQEGILAVTIWDSLDDAVAAIGGPLQKGFSSFSLLLAEPPRGSYYPVAPNSRA